LVGDDLPIFPGTIFFGLRTAGSESIRGWGLGAGNALGISRGLGIPSGGKSKIAMENVGKSKKFHDKWRFDWANHLINGGFSSRV
jgi:hypothetical protein